MLEVSRMLPSHPKYRTVLRIAQDRMARRNKVTAQLIQDGAISDKVAMLNLQFSFCDPILLDMLVEAYEKLGYSPYVVNSKTDAGE